MFFLLFLDFPVLFGPSVQRRQWQKNDENGKGRFSGKGGQPHLLHFHWRQPQFGAPRTHRVLQGVAQRGAILLHFCFSFFSCSKFRKAADTFKLLRHVMRVIMSVRPKCSYRCISRMENPLKPVLTLTHATRISIEQTSMTTKWFQHIAISIVREISLKNHRVLQGAPPRGRQLYFTFPSAPDPLFEA